MLHYRILLTALMFSFISFAASAQQQDVPTPEKMAEEMTNKYTERFDLDDYQIFMVDSTLQYNYKEMMNEIEIAKKGGRSNSETYQVICDKWYDKCDKMFESLFTEAQWAKFLKSEFGKEKKKRDKRMADRGNK